MQYIDHRTSKLFETRTLPLGSFHATISRNSFPIEPVESAGEFDARQRGMHHYGPSDEMGVY